jgi:hypothetical protein
VTVSDERVDLSSAMAWIPGFSS